ncbi:MAG: pyruvate:ferredoxin (flavodoxin) oxidoreductase [Eubacterium sp.]
MERKRTTQTMDGNMAAAHVSYAFTEAAAVYPITPSSPMAEYTEKWAAKDKKNAFGHAPLIRQMQSEAGAAGALHGILQAGALGTTYTASQGLLLMVPNLYKMAGELLPAVIHVAARALATHALSIFCDHSDVYACRQTGCAILCAANVQEVMDLGAVAHVSALEGRIPFIHFFDGFRTSHEIQKIEIWDETSLQEMIPQKAVDEFRKRALNPEHPVQRGTAQNPDIFFQTREAANGYYDRLPEIVENTMHMVNERAGTEYHLFDYYGDEEATHVIIAMGSVCDTIKETIDAMQQISKEKIGLVQVRLFRPFSRKHLLETLPKSVKQISVLDRSKEPGAVGEALYLDIVAALKDSLYASVPVFGGRYGLGSKDVTPEDIAAVYKNYHNKIFTIGICDDVTHLSLKPYPVTMSGERAYECKFWGMGADGTVGANKNSIKIIGEHTPLQVQAYFEYDSRKSGGVTISHLRFGKRPIRSAYRVYKADFVACHMPAYLERYDMVQDLRDGGIFLLNCPWKPDEVAEKLPVKVKRALAQKRILFYCIDGFAIGKEIGLGGRINTILQAAFFAISGILPIDEVCDLLKEAAEKTYGKKGQAVVDQNCKAIEEGMTKFHKIEVPEEWKNLEEEIENQVEETTSFLHYVKTIQSKINSQKGDELPVSEFVDYADGTTPLGTTFYEKRGVGIQSPQWNPDGCVQCNNCALVCPHACIRPLVIAEEERKNVPEGIFTNLRGKEGMLFAITISPLDCTGCGNCADICPGNKKNNVLEMIDSRKAMSQQPLYDYAETHENPKEILQTFSETTVKGSQFKKPLLEYSGACAGCGETAYAKLVTQLFGERLYIANATGCSSIWGGSSPSCAYTVNAEGKGPAWANSLFEDNAEFGFGMLMAQKTLRAHVFEAVEKRINQAQEQEKLLLQEYLQSKYDDRQNAEAAHRIIAYYEKQDCLDELQKEILQLKDFASKKSQWIFGGDGWAYDIGYGGLDHVLASGEDLNILVFDTEVYSNTGGQVSKATPQGAIAQFSSQGNEKRKKNLAAIAMCNDNVYVAQVALGADYNQTVKALVEAEAYEGPSLIIAYAPCINHGIKKGMGKAVEEEKMAVLSGYWHLFRYDPARRKKGENPLILDSREPKQSFEEFLTGELRYERLLRENPERAKTLFGEASQKAKEKYEKLREISLQ